MVLSKIEMLTSRCRVVYLSVPYRSGRFVLNKNIYGLNYKLYNLFNTLDDDSCFVDLNSILS